MINRIASKYLKDLNIDTRETRSELQRLIRLKFLDFCKKNGVSNSIGSYREYRSVVRALFGFDLMAKRPTYDLVVVETNLELF